MISQKMALLPTVRQFKKYRRWSICTGANHDTGFCHDNGWRDTEVRSEPAVPFGGKFRLIDFPLSNCVNSDIYNVAVLTQYRPRGLNDHIGIGKPWDLDRASGGVRLLQPYQGGPYGDWQQGTADSVRRNLDFVLDQQEEHVLILAGDHIYLMDYRPMLAQHVRRESDLTVAVRRVPVYDTHRYGIVSLDPADRIVNFQEKPQHTRETLASMGIYIFRKSVLVDVLTKNSDYIDFGRNVLPGMLRQRAAVHAYQFSGYWADGVVRTRSQECAPAKIGPHAQVGGNLLSNGSQVDGLVERSILSPGVYVAEGATVRDSVLLRDTVVEAGAIVDRAIIDRGVIVGSNAKVGAGDDNTPNTAMPSQLNTGITLVGRRSVIPEGVVLGRNVVVHPDSDVETFGEQQEIASGHDVGRSLR